MYTATLKNRLIEGGRIRWVVEFTNGTDIWTESFNVNRYTDLQPVVALRLKDLNYVDTFTIDGVVDSTLPTVVQPTQVEIDRSTWLRDFDILKKANDLIANGVVTSEHPAYVAHKNKVATNFKVEYINYL